MIKLEQLNHVIADFCCGVVDEPLCFFSEADLQSLLFAQLQKNFPDNFETSVSRGANSKGKYRTGLIHREYGVGGKQRMDIIIFSQDDVSRIDSPNLKMGKKYLTPRFGIELGTEKTADIKKHLETDIRKLSAISERGYLIYFFRDMTSADVGTKSRNNTENKIKRIFRRPVEDIEIPPNIKMLCFLLRVRRRRKILGKCEMYIPEIKLWKKVNLQAVKEKVLKILE